MPSPHEQPTSNSNAILSAIDANAFYTIEDPGAVVWICGPYTSREKADHSLEETYRFNPGVEQLLYSVSGEWLLDADIDYNLCDTIRPPERA